MLLPKTRKLSFQQLIVGLLLIATGCFSTLLFTRTDTDQVVQAATVTIEKRVSITSKATTVTQETKPLAGAQYRLQAINPTQATVAPTLANPQSYQVTTGEDAVNVLITTDQQGWGSYRNSQLPAGYYLLTEQRSAIVPHPAAPVLIHFTAQPGANTSHNNFYYVPKSGLIQRVRIPKTMKPTTRQNSAQVSAAPDQIMQSGGQVWPSWIWLILGLTILIIGQLIKAIWQRRQQP